ncbi:MAG: purH, partial [Acidimicrobiales bacterium]|nr:purH [Acidimicrobiales bacterium]
MFDKSGVVDLAAGLHDLGWRLISSGGTAKAIADAGLPVTDLAELTGFPAILGHRVVTLHPAIHGGLLADLDQPEHLADLEKYGIEPFALAVVNLYPFTSNPSIDLIDIGGPTLIRAAAKNHAHVGVVMDPAQYEPVLTEIREHGSLTATTRRSLAATAFARIAAYDAEIANWFAVDAEQPLPSSLHLSLDLAQPLRYGENPHQDGARYRRAGATSWWDTAVQHGGKELSYLNVYDTEAAWRMVNRFDAPAVVIVKHANPCGVAVRDTIAEAYVLANACDPVSAFGGIVAANREVDAEMATALA